MAPQILVVDDDELICDLVRETLSFEGYEVRAAYSGEQALTVLAQAPSDLVLLDIMMAGIDGFEVCRCMLSDDRLCDIPVIFLTAKGQFEDELRGYQEGALDYITKPFHPLSLGPIVREALTLASNRAAVEKRQRRLAKLRSLLYVGHGQITDSIDTQRNTE